MQRRTAKRASRPCGAWWLNVLTSVVEFGTSFGVSTTSLARARDNGGGRVITMEFEASKVERARENLTEAGLIDLVATRL